MFYDYSLWSVSILSRKLGWPPFDSIWISLSFHFGFSSMIFFSTDDIDELLESWMIANMRIYSECDIIYGDYAFEQWDPELLTELLSYLTPSNMRLDLMTKPFDKNVPGTYKQTNTLRSITSFLLNDFNQGCFSKIPVLTVYTYSSWQQLGCFVMCCFPWFFFRCEIWALVWNRIYCWNHFKGDSSSMGRPSSHRFCFAHAIPKRVHSTQFLNLYSDNSSQEK